MSTTSNVLIVIVAAGILALATPAQALYIETPLLIHGPEKADAGDDVELTIGPHPDNATARDDWAGKTVHLRYSYDKNERASGDPDAPVDDSGITTGDIHRGLVLDDKAGATLTWTVPAEFDGHNVDLYLEDDAGERVAFAYIAIGDAPPQMRIMAGSGPAGEEPELDHDATTGNEDDERATHEANGLGLVGILGLLGLVGLGRIRRSG